jgi:LIM domain
MISVSGPASIPSISISDMPSHTTTSTRPLPDPETSVRRPSPRHHATAPGAMSRTHWSPAVGNRATATCHQCQLPIEGRIVALKGLPERFHPHCFICHTCGTSLEALEISPEPAYNRAERLSRILRRDQGEQLDDVEGQTMADDGDERLRFYCHLDWHELFAPRCKHCKTPIIGEHTVALGEHWHYGHFFCAECGDPFEQGMTHIEKDGYAWCLNCQTKRTQRQAPKCKKCRGPVIGQYVQALGGEYHDECFRCAKCNGGFDDGQIFPRQEESETVAICVQCMERELKA